MKERRNYTIIEINFPPDVEEPDMIHGIHAVPHSRGNEKMRIRIRDGSAMLGK